MAKMTMTQKILARAAGLDHVEPGQYIDAKLDLVLGNDITAPVAIKEFTTAGATDVFDKDKIALVPDHFSPAKDIKSAEQCKTMRDFAREKSITNYFELGEMGIEHVIIPEKGLALPGQVIIGADSHTCTYGALGAFSTGIGSTDMAAGMIRGKAWFKIPEAIKVVITGEPKNRWVSGKDVVLELIGRIGVEGANYCSLEFAGDGLKHLSMDDRFTIANMAIEAGAKNGIFPVDEKTIEYLNGRTDKEYQAFSADEDAEYKQVVTIDLSTQKLVIAFPHLPDNKHYADEIEHIKVDQVVIGSCTNGRIQDMAQAAEILKGKRVSSDIRLIIIPGSREVYSESMKRGYLETFMDAGAVVSTPTCGPCLGGYMGILAGGEKCVSTTNRNFVGRMGHISSEIYLCGPAVAAATAIAGYIASPDDLK
jgi:3-isopropylmalate/(R)-2-methylmalate dehydratase large subunit